MKRSNNNLKITGTIVKSNTLKKNIHHPLVLKDDLFSNSTKDSRYDGFLRQLANALVEIAAAKEKNRDK